LHVLPIAHIIDPFAGEGNRFWRMHDASTPNPQPGERQLQFTGMDRIGRIKNPVITRKARSIPNEVIYLIPRDSRLKP